MSSLMNEAIIHFYSYGNELNQMVLKMLKAEK